VLVFFFLLQLSLAVLVQQRTANGKIAEYWGNYSDYIQQKEEERKRQVAKFIEQSRAHKKG
jgi:ATPase subunit of ABC transporter with duplicated ATPase domains